MTGTIKIQWLWDSTDCDTCGSSYADGAKVWLDDEIILELLPVASCYGGDNYDTSDVYLRVLKHLGYTIEEI